MPVGEVILNLPQKQKNYLHEQVRSIIDHLDATDVMLLMALIKSDKVIYQKILSLIQNFVTSELGLTLTS